jgi:phosphoserine phosphatase
LSGYRYERVKTINHDTKMHNSSLSNIGLIDDKDTCFIPSIELAASRGIEVRTIKAVKKNQIDEVIKKASNCDTLILDAKLFLDDAVNPCISTNPPEDVNGLAMSRAAKAIYQALTEMGKTVLVIPATVDEQACPIEMRSKLEALLG